MNFRRTRTSVSYVRNPFTPRPGYWGCMVCELDMPHSSRVPHLNGKRHIQRLQVLGLHVVKPVETVASPPDIPDRVEMVEKWVGGVVAENGEGGGVGEVEGEERGDSEGEDGSEEDDSEEDEADDDEDADEEEYEEVNEGEWNGAEEQLIDLGATNDIPDWPEISNQTSSSMSWRCTTCDETMSIFFRDQHLSGRSHAKALRGEIQTQDSDVTPEPIIPFSMTWQCTICDETMGIFYKDEHLSGKRHAKKLQARGLSQDPADSIGVPETATSTYWAPDEHDTEVNGVNDGPDHVVGGLSSGYQTAGSHLTYAEALLKPRAASENKAHYTFRPASAVEMSPHIAGAGTRGLGLQDQNEKDVKKSDNWTINNLVWDGTAKWTCMTCSMTMEMSEKGAHLDSTSHIARCNCPACTRYKSRASKESHITDTQDTKELPAETQPLELKSESGVPQHLDEPELYPGEKTKIYPKPKPGMFHCKICNAEFILEYKWMHLSTAWECKICDKWIHDDWRDRHIKHHAERSERIKAREAAAKAPAAVSAPDEPPAPPAASVSVKEEYYCPVCRKDLTMKQKTRHQWGAWQCMDCNLTVHILGGNRDMVCRRGTRKSQGQEQKHESQFLRDLGLKEEQDSKPSGLIDLLSDDIDVSIPEFSPMSEVGNQSFDDSLWGLMLGESGTATYSGDMDLLKEVFGPKSETEDQPQSTATNAPVVETPLDNEATHGDQSAPQEADEIKDIELSDEKVEVFEVPGSTAEPDSQLQDSNVCASSVADVPDLELMHGCQDHLPECAEELAEVEAEQPLDGEDDVSSETSSSVAESEDQLQGMDKHAPTFEGFLAHEDAPGSENNLSQPTEEIGDAQPSDKQAGVPSLAAPETFHCKVCEVDLSIEKKKYHRGSAWECQVCDKVMHRGSRDSHLAGAKHKKCELLKSKESLVATQIKATAVALGIPVAPDIPVAPVAHIPKAPKTEPETPTAADPETFFCETCNKMFKTKSKKTHQSREWECTVCDIKTHIAWKMSHLAGSKHANREEKALLANAVAASSGSVGA